MEKKRVLMAFYSPIYSPGGKSERLQGYLDEFEKQGDIEVNYFGFHETAKNFKEMHSALKSYKGSRIAPFLASILARTLRPIGYSAFGRFIGINIIAYKAAYSKELKQSDVVFTSNFFWPLVKRAKKLGVDVVLEVSDTHPLHLYENEISRLKKNEFNKKYQRYHKIIVTQASKSIEEASAVIVFSEYAKKTFEERKISDKVCLLRPPLAKETIISTKIPDHPIFVCVATNTLRKGTDLLLKAWGQYKTNGGLGTLYVIGKPDNSFTEMMSSMQLTDVKLLGHVNTAKLFSDKICFLVIPSFSEGRPRIVLEALASGSPVISSTEASADLVKDDYNGIIIKKTVVNILDTLFKIENLCQKDIETLSANAKESIKHDIKTSEFYVKTYELLKVRHSTILEHESCKPTKTKRKSHFVK